MLSHFAKQFVDFKNSTMLCGEREAIWLLTVRNAVQPSADVIMITIIALKGAI